MTVQARWRTVVVLGVVLTAIVAGFCAVIATMAVRAALQLLADDFLFILGVVFGLPLMLFGMVPLAFAALLTVWLVRMIRRGPTDAAGPRFVAMLTTAGVALMAAGMFLQGQRIAMPLLASGIVVSVCAAAMKSIATDRKRS